MWVNYCFHKDSLKLFMQSLLFRSYIDILFAQFDRPLSQTSLTSKFKQRRRAKGQLISKCPFGRKTSSKKPTKLFLDCCPEIFL